MKIKKGKIVFFDSGVGGLTLLKECVQRYPREEYLYFGDNARAPYGNLGKEKVMDYASEAFEYFNCLQVRAAVIACNTVTAVCAEKFRSRYSFPVFGVEPAVRPAMLSGGRVLVLATRATVESEKFRKLVLKWENPNAEIIVRAVPELAGEIEKNIYNLSDFKVEKFLPDIACDSVVLGCTHYIFLKERIGAFYGCPIYDGNEGTVKNLGGRLHLQEGANNGLSTDDHKAEKSIENSINLEENTNKCLKIFQKTTKSRIIFQGSGAEKNKKVFYSVF